MVTVFQCVRLCGSYSLQSQLWHIMEKRYFSANHQTDVQIDTDTTREMFISKEQENLLWYPSTKCRLSPTTKLSPKCCYWPVSWGEGREAGGRGREAEGGP